MLSYQHAFHAGNPADLHKHIVLAGLLNILTQKPRGITYMETHAGRALYHLDGPEAAKTKEAEAGIARISIDPTTPYGGAINAIRAQHGEAAYPGSPFIAAHFHRTVDRAVLMEKHPAEGAALKRAMGPTRAEVHLRDGYEGVLAISPPQPRRGLVLIDPSYEVKTEYDQVAEFIPKLIAKWPEAAVLLWYPHLIARRHEPMLRRLSGLGGLRRDVSFDLGKERQGMTGSGLLLINPPYGAEAAFDAAVAQTSGVLTAS